DDVSRAPAAAEARAKATCPTRAGPSPARAAEGPAAAAGVRDRRGCSVCRGILAGLPADVRRGGQGAAEAGGATSRGDARRTAGYGQEPPGPFLPGGDSRQRPG